MERINLKIRSCRISTRCLFFCVFITLSFAASGCGQFKNIMGLKPCGGAKHIPAALETITVKDKTVWERVNEPGFGSDNNISVAAMEEYKGSLYVMTRNDVEGGEVWRASGNSWEQVLFPGGETNGIYGNPFINNLFAAMVVFQDKLYFGFSSGFQGGTLKSTGAEIWTYDGTTWEPVISDKKDTEEAGTITEMSGCEDNDGDVTGRITDRTKKWIPDQWAGGVLQITSGDGIYRRFDIYSNTSDTLTIQKNGLSGETGTEYTICDSVHYVNAFPPYEFTSGGIQAGDSYAIGTGYDENGFGSYWNRAINCMVIFNGKLYVGTGLNYEYGSQVWYTDDGETWTKTKPSNSFDVFHTDPTFPHSRKPVIVTALSLCASSVSGSEVLYAGGTGSTGDAGACSRMAKLTENGWEMIVDANVDENDTGTNENGFGDGMSCTMFNGNFMPWSLADFKDKLYVGINTIAGARVMYTPTGSSADGSWFFSAGGDSGIPNGFDGRINEGASAIMKALFSGSGDSGIPNRFKGKNNEGAAAKELAFYKNIVANVYATEDYLYAGLVSSFIPALGGTKEYLTGAQLWKTGDGKTWQQVVDDGFGDNEVITFESFTQFGGTLYVSGSKGANSVIGGIGGAKVFRLVK